MNVMLGYIALFIINYYDIILISLDLFISILEVVNTVLTVFNPLT
jgi:hypothetical protein